MHFMLHRFSLAEEQLNPWVKSEPRQLRQNTNRLAFLYADQPWHYGGRGDKHTHQSRLVLDDYQIKSITLLDNLFNFKILMKSKPI